MEMGKGAMVKKKTAELKEVIKKPERPFNAKPNVPDPKILSDPKVEAPALFIMGEKDYVFKFLEDYLMSGQVKKFVPNLEIIYVPEGSHFVQERFPDKVNQQILTFLARNS